MPCRTSPSSGLFVVKTVLILVDLLKFYPEIKKGVGVEEKEKEKKEKRGCKKFVI